MNQIESSWFSKYSIPINYDNKYIEYINKLSNKSYDKNIEYKINMIEEQYKEKLKDIENLCIKKDEIEIIKNKSSLVILQKELEIIKLLTKYTLQNKNLNYEFLSTCLNILLSFSETLRIRIDQKELIHDKINKNENCDTIISRCSYKFCSYKDNCTYNYNLKTKNLCYQDHYVHNMVSADLKILLDYINKNYTKNKLIIHNKEILKSINTLSFVISHMESELKTKCIYVPESEWESYHVVKNKNISP
jgi:hypothetical protein